jgi:class 3 adenylate cyclase
VASVETVTVLITDLVGSTALGPRVGPTVADALRREHFGVLRESIEASQGREVENLGDGLMVVFASASGGVGCAVAMQQAMERRNRFAEQPLHVRIGVGAPLVRWARAVTRAAARPAS